MTFVHDLTQKLEDNRERNTLDWPVVPKYKPEVNIRKLNFKKDSENEQVI